MEPYDAFDAIEPFAAATRAFDRLKGALAGLESAALGVGPQASGSTSGCVNRTGLPSDRA